MAVGSLDAEEIASLRTAADALGLSVDDAAADRIGCYLELLGLWNQRFHLTGERDRRTLLTKHVVDSMAPALLLPAAGRVIDIGTGAGFPGIILACLRPELDVVLLESRRRPCSFLAEAIRVIPLPHARALESRAEDAVGGFGSTAATVISRAIRLDQLLPLAAPLLAPEGVVIAMQTPRISDPEVDRIAASAGLRRVESHDYRLPGAESRRLIRFVRV